MTYNTIDNDVTMPGNERALLANRYRIIKQLGQGGMGSVWLAEDMQLDNKQFAIKMLPSILVSNKRAYRQLQDEALVALNLTHSPEQLNGEAPKPAQDIYSFAAMAYECIKGKPPFSHGQIEFQIMNKVPAPLPEGACVASVMSGLAKKPEDRPATCVGVLSGGVLTQSRRDAERQSVDSSRAERVEKTEGGARNGGLGKVFGVLGLVIGAFGLGALISPAKAEEQSGAQPPTVRQPDSKPVTREDASPKDGDTKTMTLPGGVKMEMVYVAPGTFKMGSYGEDNEKPVHDVRITKGYWIGKYPVTQSQWKALVSANGVSFAKGEPVPYFSTSGEGRDSVAGLDTSDFPMENISWDDCDKFVKALNRKEGGGRTWSMPTEAQWEFAARGGNKSHGYTYSGGNDMNALG